MEVKRDDKKKTVTITFPIPMGEGIINMGVNDKKFNYEIIIGGKKKNFKNNKALWNIGDTNHCNLFKTIKKVFQSLKVYPDFGQENSEKDLKEFAFELSCDELDIEGIFDEFKEETNKEKKEGMKTKADEIGETSYFEKFQENDYEITSHHLSIARELIEGAHFMDYCLNTLEKVVKMEREKSCLALCIALTSLWGKPIHGLAVAGPGRSKSTINDHVVELFPNQRKIKISADFSVNALYRMTQYKEGAHILDHILIQVGDVGSEAELKNKNLEELLTTLKRLMSEGKAIKSVCDTAKDNNGLLGLNLQGIGSVLIETIAPKIEDQFDDRALKWSPDWSESVRKAIREFRNNPLKKIRAEIDFDIQKIYCRAGIELLYKSIENIKELGLDFVVLNPYMDLITYENFDMRNSSARAEEAIPKLPEAMAITNLFNHDKYITEYKGKKQIAIVVRPEEYLYTLEMTGRAAGYIASNNLGEEVVQYAEIIQLDYLPLIDRKFSSDELQEFKEDVENGKEPDEEIKEWIKKNKKYAVKAKELGELMKVGTKQAYTYLDELAKNGMLCKIEMGAYDVPYYPTSDFEKNLENYGAKYPTKEMVQKGSKLAIEADKAYDNFLESMEETYKLHEKGKSR